MICKACGKSFILLQKGSGGNNRIFCYECMPTGMNRTERNRKRHTLLVEYFSEIKLKRGCDKCGYNKCAAALEWHHPTNDKLGDPCMVGRYSIDKYLIEIEKCELLCANCHREKHNS